ncbi:hypothetical protein C8R45DRAFT_139899 [Mycena sanguinolenta]|nr:hypothetical protein C8R45DRAFT_139899 [Mycena sanguinolenta]
MDSDRDLPPLPIRPPEISEPRMSMPEPTTVPVAGSSRRHSHRSKATTSVRDLTALILKEQSDHRETQRELLRVNELLHLANLRADAAEKNVTLAIERLKTVNEERLYKFQLETAQHEIHRAQSVFNIVERERYQAEVAGAKSRTAARRLNEEHKIHLAREEGRRAGMKEGFQAGRLGIWADGGGTPAPSNFGDTQPYDYYTDADFDNELLESPNGSITPEEDLDSGPSNPPSPNPPSIGAPPSLIAPGRQRPSSIAPPAQARDTPAPMPIPPPVPAAPPTFTPFHDIHPIPVHNEAPHPWHEHVIVPPEGYIPTTGPDGLVHLPPAHEFSIAPRSNASVGEESSIAPSTFTKAMSLRGHARSPGQHTDRAPSIIAENVRRVPSTVGSSHPVQMPTPRMNTDLAGIDRHAQQRSSFSSDFYGGRAPTQAPLSGDESDPIPINIQSPVR